MFAWIACGYVAFAATFARAWIGRLERLGARHDPWLWTGLHFSVAFSAVAVLAYVGAVAGFVLMPDAFKSALAARGDDRWAYAVAVACGAALGLFWFAIFTG